MLRSTAAAILLASAAHAGPVDDAREMYLQGDHEAALAVLRPAAEAGDANAQNILGDAYDSGNGVAVDHAVARNWWERAAEQGFDKAQHNLGLLFEHGRPGIEPDYAKAAEYYEAATENGNPTAPTDLGYLYERGVIGGASRSFGAPGRGPQAEPDFDKAAEFYEIGIERGDAQAMANLGTFLVHGTGVPEDMGRAMTLFRQAGAMGHDAALSNLGAMYENGYGTAPDPLAAFALYAMAARGGHAQAAVNMGWMLYEGTAPGGAPTDPAMPLAYCWWGIDLEGTDGATSRFAEDCGLLSEGLDDETVARAGGIADRLAGLSSDG